MQKTGKWGKAESQDYFEEQSQKKIVFVPNLSMFLFQINMQFLRLPHEVIDPSTNQPSGVTHDDIVTSCCEAIEIAYTNTAHIRRQLQTEYDGPEAVDFKTAKKKLEWIYLLLDDADYLNDRMITLEMDNAEEYDDTLDKPSGTMPAPLDPADGKAVGKVEGENKEPVVSPPLA